MHWQYTPYVIPLLVTAAISTALAVYAWRHRNLPGAMTSTLLMLAVTEWVLTYALELCSADLQTEILWDKVEFLGGVIVPATWLVLALQYTGQERWLTPRNLALLAIEPVVIVLLVWTNEWHSLIWKDTWLDTSSGFSMLGQSWQVGYWIHTAYSYGLILLGVLVLGAAYIRQQRLYRGQAGVLLVGALAPLAGNVLSLSYRLNPVPYLDWTPFAFTVSGLALAWGLFRFRLLDLVPVARDAVVEGMSDGVIVLDAHDRVVDLNPAAQQIIGRSASQAIGEMTSQALSTWPDLMDRCRNMTEGQAEITLKAEGEVKRDYDLRISPLTDRRGRHTGRLVVLRDITEHKQVEVKLRAQRQLFENVVAVARATTERPTLEATLQNALDVAATLTGAERGDLFLLNEAGRIISSVLASDGASGERREILGQVMEKGLAGWATRHRQAVLIADTAQDERWLELPGRPYTTRSALSVPILSGSALLGILTLTHSQPGHFAAEHLQLMQAAADQMALAVRNAQIFDEQRRMAERQITLYQVLRAVSGQLDPGAVARAAAEAVVQFAGWPNVAVVLPDENQQNWIVRAAGGLLSTTVGLRFPIVHSVVGRAFKTAQTQLVPDVNVDSDYAAGHPSIHSELAVPLRRGERVLGVLNLESDRLAAFDSEDVLLAESLADAVAMALDNARLYAESRQRAADLSALYALSRTTGQSLALDQVLVQALSSAIALFGYEAGLVGLADLGTGGEDEVSAPLRIVAHRGLPPEQLEHLRLAGLGGTLCTCVYDQRESMVIGDLSQEQSAPIRAMATELAAFGWRAYAGVPLLHQKRALGVLCLFARKPRASSAYDLALLTTIGGQVTTAVENARLFQSTMYERSRLQAVIKSSRDGVVLVGMDGRALVVNARALQLMHLPGLPEDWLGRHIKNALRVLHIYAPEVVRAMLEEMRRARNGDEPPSEGEFDMPPHTIHWLSLPVLAGTTPLGRLMLLRDVTDERAVERLREDMTRTMVHDLRNPLSSIYSALEFLEGTTDLSADQRLVIEIANESTQKMVGLVNSIMDVSRLESGRMPIKYVQTHLGDLVAKTLQAQGPLAADKGLRLEGDVPPTLPPAWADVDLIGRVLQNLVGNAIKFTPPGGVVRVTARVGERDSLPVLLVSVSDTGLGIPSEIRGQLFQKFVSGRQEERGSGLGLAFCKLAIEAHGEHISVESTLGQGTTFTFSLATASRRISTS